VLPNETEKEAAVDTSDTIRKAVAAALMSAAAAAGMWLASGTAQAQPHVEAPTHGAWPQDPVPPGASGPYVCCPADQAGGLHPDTGRGCPGVINWDKSVCHTWYGVYWGHGNVAPGIWEGGPPPPEALKKPWCGFPFMCSGTP
jgi:hypothetical protein